MSNEHMQHCQCQTCFVHFPTNQELIQHIEGYRSTERLLVAKLERCRLHLAQSYDINSDDDDGDDRDEEDDDHEPTTRPDQLQCPFRGCRRVERYTTRSNLVRHFQTHIECYEMCPFCQEIFRRVHSFVRHDCSDRSKDTPKDTYMQYRVAQLHRMVGKELDRLQGPLSHTRKRAHGVVDSGSTRAQKMVKTTQISVLPANISLRSHLSVACSMGTDDGLTSPSETMKATATNDTDETFAKTATIRPSNNTESIFSSETTIGMPANDGGWAFTTSMTPTNNGWEFADTALAPANNSGWAFANTALAPADEGGWAFANMAPAPADDGGWAFTVR